MGETVVRAEPMHASDPLEEVPSPHGSGFMFAAEAFAQLVFDRDFEEAKRAAEASLDNTATLGTVAQSARSGRAIEIAEVPL